MWKESYAKINQYSLDWELIKTWESIKLAVETTGVSKLSIIHVLKKRNITWWGFKWEYFDKNHFRYKTPYPKDENWKIIKPYKKPTHIWWVPIRKYNQKLYKKKKFKLKEQRDAKKNLQEVQEEVYSTEYNPEYLCPLLDTEWIWETYEEENGYQEDIY